MESEEARTSMYRRYKEHCLTSLINQQKERYCSKVPVSINFFLLKKIYPVYHAKQKLPTIGRAPIIIIITVKSK